MGQEETGPGRGSCRNYLEAEGEAEGHEVREAIHTFRYS